MMGMRSYSIAHRGVPLPLYPSGAVNLKKVSSVFLSLSVRDRIILYNVVHLCKWKKGALDYANVITKPLYILQAYTSHPHFYIL